MTKYPGLPVGEYVFPAISFGGMDRLDESGALKRMDDAADAKAQKEAVLDVIHEAAKRNYPDMTMSALKEVIDVQNMRDVVRYVLGAHRLPEPKPGEAGSP